MRQAVHVLKGHYMEISLVLLSKLISMMLMAIVGYALVRLGLLKQEDRRVLSILLVYVLQPCLIARSLQIDLTPERVQGFLYSSAFAAATMLLSLLVSELLKKHLALDAIDRSTLIYANVGNLLLPLVSMALGDEMVFYCSAFQIPFNILMWTHCYSIIKGDRDISLRKIVANPNLIALFIGIVLLLTHTKIPSVIDAAAKGFHDMVAASSMMLVGMVIAGIDIRSVFTHKKAYLISFGRLVALPVLCMLMLYLTGFVQSHPSMRPVFMVITIGAAAPSASTIVQLAVLHDRDAAKAGIYNVMSTILCVITIPLIILLFQIIFPA